MRDLMTTEVLQISGGNDTILTVKVKGYVSTADGSFVADHLSQLMAREGKNPLSTIEALVNHLWESDSELTFLSAQAPCAFMASFL